MWKNTLNNKLRKLKIKSYQDYLQSNFWKAAKERYRTSDLPKHCLNCCNNYYELHHRSYARLGKERPTDLIPLCRECHQAIHNYLKENNTHLAHVHVAIRLLFNKSREEINRLFEPFGINKWNRLK